MQRKNCWCAQKHMISLGCVAPLNMHLVSTEGNSCYALLASNRSSACEIQVADLESKSASADKEACIDFLETCLHECDAILKRHVGPPQPGKCRVHYDCW